MSNSSIWPIDRRTFSGATTPSQSGPGSNGNEGILQIPQSFSITGDSPSDCLISYPGHSLEESYSSAEKQSVYSTAPANWADSFWDSLISWFFSKLTTLSVGLRIHWLYILQELPPTHKKRSVLSMTLNWIWY